MDISRTSAQRILKKLKFRPYKYHISIRQQPQDNVSRMNLGRRLKQGDIDFKNILCTDEAVVTNNGILNRYWPNENPHLVYETRKQTIIRMNVWWLIIDGTILGPIFYEENLNAPRYIDLIINGVIAAWLDTLTAENRSNVWFQQDGASAVLVQHTTRQLWKLDYKNYSVTGLS